MKRVLSANPSVVVTVVFAMVLALAWPTAWSQAQAPAQRDPTLPPAAVGLSAVPGEARPPEPDVSQFAVIVRDGQPYLVVGTRLYAQGQMLGAARIERIGETEIWLREGGQLRKIVRFPGVRKTLTASTSTPVECAPVARKPSTAKAPGATGGAVPTDPCAIKKP